MYIVLKLLHNLAESMRPNSYGYVTCCTNEGVAPYRPKSAVLRKGYLPIYETYELAVRDFPHETIHYLENRRSINVQ